MEPMKISQLLKHTAWVQSSEPTLKEPGVYTCNPSVGEAESGRSLELTGYPDWPNLVAGGGEGGNCDD